MNKITTEINDVYKNVQQERNFLSQNIGSKAFVKNLSFNDEAELNKFISHYFEEKNQDWTTDDYWFKNVWKLLSFEERNNVIENLKTQKQNKLAEELQSRLVIFEDLIEENYESFKQLIKKVDKMILTIALKRTNDWSDYDLEKILVRLYSCLSSKEASMLDEDIEFSGPVLKSQVLQARKKICDELVNIKNAGKEI